MYTGCSLVCIIADMAHYDDYKKTKEYATQKSFLQKESDKFLQSSRERKSVNYLCIACSSYNKDDEPMRVPQSTKFLDQTVARAKALYPDLEINAKMHNLYEMDFDHCEANYSTQGEYCTFPCRLSQRKAQKWETDTLMSLYHNITDRADVVLIATPVRRWAPSSLYFKLTERMTSIQNQQEIYDVNLIHNKSLGIIAMGAQDGIQHVMGQIFSIWTQFGFEFPKHPYVGYTAWGFTNYDMDQVSSNVERDMEIVQDMMDKMVRGQIEQVLMRRAYEKISQ